MDSIHERTLLINWQCAQHVMRLHVDRAIAFAFRLRCIRVER